MRVRLIIKTGYLFCQREKNLANIFLQKWRYFKEMQLSLSENQGL